MKLLKHNLYSDVLNVYLNDSDRSFWMEEIDRYLDDNISNDICEKVYLILKDFHTRFLHYIFYGYQ